MNPILLYEYIINKEAYRDQGHKHATVNTTGCGFDSHSVKLNISYFHIFALVTGQSAVLSATNKHAMST